MTYCSVAADTGAYYRAVGRLFPRVSSHKLDDERIAYAHGILVGHDAKTGETR